MEWNTRLENNRHAWKIGLCENVRISLQNNGKKNSKPIIQLDMQGNFIAEFESISQASRQLNLSHTGISCVLKDDYSQTGGFKFILKGISNNYR